MLNLSLSLKYQTPDSTYGGWWSAIPVFEVVTAMQHTWGRVALTRYTFGPTPNDVIIAGCMHGLGGLGHTLHSVYSLQHVWAYAQ